MRWKADETGLENVDLAASGSPTNASVVTYSAGNNFTGGVNRTVENKFTEIVSVEDFGADRTGTFDSHAAFEAAALYVNTNNLTLRIPAGSYISSSVLDWSSYLLLNVIGDGHLSSIINFTSIAVHH